jgi:hypothetical protein
MSFQLGKPHQTKDWAKNSSSTAVAQVVQSTSIHRVILAEAKVAGT